MFITRKPQTGVTLIELLIGLLIGLIVIAGGLSVFTTSVRGQADNIKLTRLNQDLRAMMDIMVRDIRRAGFVTSDLATPDPADLVPPIDPINLPYLRNNPFFNTVAVGATTDIAVYDGGSCIVYAYNRDDDIPPYVDYPSDTDGDNNPSEFLGFRLSNGKLVMRTSGATNENCTNGSWETITEPEVEITELTFTLTSTPLDISSMRDDDDKDGIPEATDTDGIPYGDDNDNGLCDTGEACNTCTRDNIAPDPACLYVRNVIITLTGRLRDDINVTQTITEQVRVRNDKFLSALL